MINTCCVLSDTKTKLIFCFNKVRTITVAYSCVHKSLYLVYIFNCMDHYDTYFKQSRTRARYNMTLISKNIIGCSMIALASMHYILSMLSVHFFVNYTVLKLRGVAVLF